MQSARADFPIVFYAFDLLSRNGSNLRNEPLLARWIALHEMVTGADIRISSVLQRLAEHVVTATRSLGLVGVVAKRIDSNYRSGDRLSDWQKLRLRRGQEFVIGGFRPGMHPFESLLVGYYDGKQLMFAGKVRSG